MCLTHPPKCVWHHVKPPMRVFTVIEKCQSARGSCNVVSDMLVVTANRELAYVLGDAQPVEVLVAQQEHCELMAPLAADAGAHLRVRPCVACLGALAKLRSRPDSTHGEPDHGLITSSSYAAADTCNDCAADHPRAGRGWSWSTSAV